MSAYLLTLGVFIPLSGWVADQYGARRVFTAAIVLFTLASVAWKDEPCRFIHDPHHQILEPSVYY